MLRKMLQVTVGLCVAAWPLRAQNTNSEQLWFEYMLNLPFANAFNLENALVTSTATDQPKWRSLDYTPTLEWSINEHIDVMGAVTLAFTAQTESDNTFEVRPMLGSRIHITPNKRILTRVYARLEQRNFKNLETNEWTHAWRPRARFESLIPINRPSYFTDKLVYGIADAEWLFVKDDVKERFANRFRLRTGIGYRLSYTWRFEFIYMMQQSRNEMEDGFATTDSIFRFRIKHYLRKTSSSVLEGSGN